MNAPFGVDGTCDPGDPSKRRGDGSAADVITYTFSTPLPAGVPFLLWDPGAGESITDRHDSSASLNGALCRNTSGWSYSIQYPFGIGTTE